MSANRTKQRKPQRIGAIAFAEPVLSNRPGLRLLLGLQTTTHAVDAGWQRCVTRHPDNHRPILSKVRRLVEVIESNGSCLECSGTLHHHTSIGSHPHEEGLYDG